MTTSDINIAITSDDMNRVITENPLVGLQLKIAALTRVVDEQQVRIEELKAQTKAKKGS
jgi:hypothetical protein